MNRVSPVILAALVADPICASATASTSRGGSPPTPGDFDVLVVVLDDVGTEKVGKEFADGTYQSIYDQVTDTIQPSCDQLYTMWSQGIRFDNAYVTPLCSSSRAALLTGRYGSSTGIGYIVPEGNCNSGKIYSPADWEVFLPRLLELGHDIQADGVDYHTAAFGKWHLSERDCDPTERGFDHFVGHMANNMNPFPCDYGILAQRHHFTWRKTECPIPGGGSCSSSPGDCSTSCCWSLVTGATDATTWDASVVTDAAIDWINGLPEDEPFFAWVAYNPPHVPQQVPPAVDQYGRTTGAWLSYYGYQPGDFPKDQGGPNEEFHRHLVHNAMIEGVDRQMGRILSEIDADRLARTLVVAVCDNGSDMNQVQPGTINGETVPAGHGKRSVFELGVRVPLVVRLPDTWPTSETFANAPGFVQAADLWRTVGAVTGLSDATMDQVVADEIEPQGGTSESLSFYEMLVDPDAASLRATNYSEAFLKNGYPQVPPRNQAVTGLYTAGGWSGSHRMKYMRVYDGSADGSGNCAIAAEGFYDLEDNPLEDPAGNLIDTTDPDLVAILDELKLEVDAIYKMDMCPWSVFDCLPVK